MSYIILDFEYNQAFDFSSKTKKSINNRCPFEIIQIGGVKLDETLNIVSVINEYIKPSIYKKMHPHVERLTNISNETLKNSPSFMQVYPILVDFIDDGTLCFWGGNDLKELRRNVKFYNLDLVSIPRKFIDIQKLASGILKIPNGNAVGLKNAVQSFDINIDSLFHDALNDAFYTAEVFKVVQKHIKNKILPTNTIKENNQIYKYDYVKIYTFAENELGRKLTKKEKKLVTAIYEFGSKGSFDFKNI